MSATLVLDRSYSPITTISWQKAVTLLTLGKIEVIEEYQDKILRSRSWVIKMPAVVRLLKAFRRNKKQEVKFSRSNILARDKFKCGYCGKKLTLSKVTYDHIVPKSKGGCTTWENIISCCSECNIKKGNRKPAEANMKLRKKPTKPSWVPLIVIGSNSSIPDQWRSYLYWFATLEE